MTSPSPCGRRDRQLREIAALVATGDQQRAAGLALEHLVCFPHDAAVLTDTGALSDPTDPTAVAGRNPRRDP